MKQKLKWFQIPQVLHLPLVQEVQADREDTIDNCPDHECRRQRCPVFRAVLADPAPRQSRRIPDRRLVPVVLRDSCFSCRILKFVTVMQLRHVKPYLTSRPHSPVC